MNVEAWLMGVLIGLDQLGSAVCGTPDETVSSRAGRGSGLWRAVDGFLGLFQDRHGLRSIEWTPWGTVDPHHATPVNQAIAKDWEALRAVLARPEASHDLAPLLAAERAAARLRAWEDSGGRSRWAARMRQDLTAGEEVWTHGG